jgi:hypothetical protein
MASLMATVWRFDTKNEGVKVGEWIRAEKTANAAWNRVCGDVGKVIAGDARRRGTPEHGYGIAITISPQPVLPGMAVDLDRGDGSELAEGSRNPIPKDPPAPSRN